MAMETAMRARLLADAAVSAVCGDRVAWTNRPQASAYPAVTMLVISDQYDQHMKGFQGLRGTRVQIDCMARSAAEKVALRDAVIAAIAGPFVQGSTSFDRSQRITVRDLGADSTGGFIHRDSIDLTIWHKEI